MTSPKIRLIYYKNIVERCFLSFINDRQDCFTRNDSGNYVLSSTVSGESLSKYFECGVIGELKKCAAPFDIIHPQYTFLIGGCDPKNNILLDFKTPRFPDRLSKFLKSDRNIRYVMTEHDILIDIDMFNSVFDSVFNKLFSSRKRFLSALGKNRQNVFIIKHNRLDCYSMFKILKYIYGKNNCVNVYTEMFADDKKFLISVNDMIGQYTLKKSLNSSKEFKQIVEDIKLYTEGCIAGVNNNV